MLSAFFWILGGVLIVGALAAGEMAGESLWAPDRYTLGAGSARMLCIICAVGAAVCWRIA